MNLVHLAQPRPNLVRGEVCETPRPPRPPRLYGRGGLDEPQTTNHQLNLVLVHEGGATMTDLPPDSYLARFDAGWTGIDGYWWRPTDTGHWEHQPMTEAEMVWHHTHTQERR